MVEPNEKRAAAGYKEKRAAASYKEKRAAAGYNEKRAAAGYNEKRAAAEYKPLGPSRHTWIEEFYFSNLGQKSDLRR